jgi:hypothetical protein
MKVKKIESNGGYASTAESCEVLTIEKDGVDIRLNGNDVAELYNFLRPVGTAPRMELPDPQEKEVHPFIPPKSEIEREHRCIACGKLENEHVG